MESTRTEPTQEEYEKLIDLGWIPMGGWSFFKDGVLYDLSAANLDKLEQIEFEGLFVVDDE